jgi:CHAD domain-containing protein
MYRPPHMATTQGSKAEDAKLETPPYTEHDKLGPLGHASSVLADHGELRRALIAEFTDATIAAKRAADEVDHQGAATAVHDYRKALRRARAVLSMVAEALPKHERRAVKRALQEARRAVSTARDQTVAPDALAQLPLGDQERTTANAVLANAGDAMSPIAEIKQLLADGASRAAQQLEALEAALPAQIGWHVVADGVAAVYGEARAARKKAKKSRTAFHQWRRRAKELAYQLEWVAGHAGPRLQETLSEYDAVSSALGPAVDLVMLHEFVTTHAQGVAADALEHLTTAIDAQLADLMKLGRKAGKTTFDDSRKQFAKRLTRHVKKDLKPAEPEASNGHAPESDDSRSA